MARLPGWAGTTWDAHIGSVLEFVNGVSPRTDKLPLSSPMPLLSRLLISSRLRGSRLVDMPDSPGVASQLRLSQ